MVVVALLYLLIFVISMIASAGRPKKPLFGEYDFELRKIDIVQDVILTVFGSSGYYHDKKIFVIGHFGVVL